MNITDTSSTIVTSVVINASAAKVFAALTEPEQLMQWWGDDAVYRSTSIEGDLRVGGTWRTTGTSADGEAFAVSGRYLIVEPPHLLEYTWNHEWGGGPAHPETVVRYELDERDGVTHLRLTHSGFVDPADKADHEAGWALVLGWLRAYAE